MSPTARTGLIALCVSLTLAGVLTVAFLVSRGGGSSGRIKPPARSQGKDEDDLSYVLRHEWWRPAVPRARVEDIVNLTCQLGPTEGFLVFRDGSIHRPDDPGRRDGEYLYVVSADVRRTRRYNREEALGKLVGLLDAAVYLRNR